MGLIRTDDTIHVIPSIQRHRNRSIQRVIVGYLVPVLINQHLSVGVNFHFMDKDVMGKQVMPQLSSSNRDGSDGDVPHGWLEIIRITQFHFTRVGGLGNHKALGYHIA